MSRINVLTRVQRVDIAQIYRKKAPLKLIISDIGHRAIEQWNQDKRYHTKDGKPNVLGFTERNSDFVKLGKLVTSSVGPKAVLFDLERLGVVERTSVGLKLSATTVRNRRDY